MPMPTDADIERERIRREEAEAERAADCIVLELDHNEAQAILNALKESGVLDAPLIFDHVRTLVRKVSVAMVEAGFKPL